MGVLQNGTFGKFPSVFIKTTVFKKRLSAQPLCSHGCLCLCKVLEELTRLLLPVGAGDLHFNRITGGARTHRRAVYTPQCCHLSTQVICRVGQK